MTAVDLAEQQLALGAKHYEAGRLEEAMAVWREGMKGDADDAAFHSNLGLALSDLGQNDEAAAHWREAIRLYPDFYEPHFHLVCALADKLDEADRNLPWQEVRQLCRDALALEPDVAVQKAYLLRLLGVAEWELGDRRRAITTLQASITAEPDQWTYERLGQMQRRLGHWRGMWRTAVAMCELPNLDPAPYEQCRKRVQLFGVLFLVLGGVLLFRKLKRER